MMFGIKYPVFLSNKIVAHLRSNKILIAGNGGSATMADHMAGELVGTFYGNKPLFALSLTNSAIITAIANDLGYEHIFSRQIQAYGKKGDLLILFTTTNMNTRSIIDPHSANIQNAITVANKMGIKTIIFPQIGKTTEDIQDNQQKLMHEVCKRVKQYFK